MSAEDTLADRKESWRRIRVGLTGLGGKLLRGEIPVTDRPPGLTNAPSLVR